MILNMLSERLGFIPEIITPPSYNAAEDLVCNATTIISRRIDVQFFGPLSHVWRLCQSYSCGSSEEIHCSILSAKSYCTSPVLNKVTLMGISNVTILEGGEFV